MSNDFIREYVIKRFSRDIMLETISTFYYNKIPEGIENIKDLKYYILDFLNIYGMEMELLVHKIDFYKGKYGVVIKVLDDELLDEMINYYVNVDERNSDTEYNLRKHLKTLIEKE